MHNMTKIRALALLPMLLVSLPSAAGEWFQVRNEGLLTGAVSLPVLAPTRPEAGRVHFGARFELVNDFVHRDDGDEQVLFDGETYRLSLTASGRLNDHAHWTVRIPFLHQGGGVMDGFINDWHDFFNLPDGGREFSPNSEYRYRVVRNGEVLLDSDDGGNRIGDIEIAWHLDLLEKLMLGAQLKLPTGNEDKLAGGGAIGGSLWLTQEWEWRRLAGFVSAGVSGNGRGGLLKEQQQRFTPFGGAGVSLRLQPWVRLVTQVYAHRSAFEGFDSKPLDDPGVQLASGLIFRLGEVTRLQLLFQEDIITQSSPDFSMQAAIYW